MIQALLGIKSLISIGVAGSLMLGAMFLGLRKVWLEKAYKKDSQKVRMCYSECVKKAKNENDLNLCYNGLINEDLKECK